MEAYYKDTFFKITSRELLEKVKLDYEILVKDTNGYNIFNFFVTAYHLKDYIVNEFGLNENKDIRTFKNMQELLDLAGFIANKGKHFKVINKNYKTMETRFYSGKHDGTMLFDGTHHYDGKVEYKVFYGEDKVKEVKELAKELLNCWKDFFVEKEIAFKNNKITTPP